MRAVTTRHTTNTHEANTSGRNWYNSLLTVRRNPSCLELTTRGATDTREADTLGRNWYNSLLTVRRNPSCLELTTRGATDTREADTLGRNWYNFFTAGRKSYFPRRNWISRTRRRGVEDDTRRRKRLVDFHFNRLLFYKTRYQMYLE